MTAKEIRGLSLQELNEKPNAMERLARERYFMKRPNEDIFIIK